MEFKGEEQRDAGDRNRDAKHDNRPENQLLTCVEFACWGMNAFGKVPSFNDKGDIVRAILAIGQQDVDYRELVSEEGIDLISVPWVSKDN